MSAPCDARSAGVRADAPARIDHVKLPMIAAFIGGGESRDDRRRIFAARHCVERGSRVERIAKRLRRQGADAGADVRA